jgi:gas vesicle protein
MNLRKLDRFTPFAAGLAIGVTATLLLVPEAGGNTRNHIRNAARRVGDGPKTRAEKRSRGQFGISSEEMTAGIDNGGRRETMSDMKDKAKQKIDDAVDGAKKAVDKVVDKSKDVAHSVGKKMEEGGKRLQDA